MDKPIMNYFAYLSASWEVKKSDWNGIPIEVYYDKKHPYNVDRMIESTKKSLDYFTREFTPYQHRQVRILEFPGYSSFAQSFSNTIPYSEGIGFVASLRNQDDVDYVYYVTAHEMAHQWWGHQVIGANVQGSSLLMETLSQYSAMMVMEKAYGREKMRRFLRYELDRYLRERGGEEIEEQPLYRVENQQYIHYRKGSLVFYRLRDEIGEAPLNRALKRYLQDKGFQEPPFTTTKELLEYIRAEAPADKQDLITDLLEKIVFYDNRVTEATARKRSDGQWDVTFKLHLAKTEADGKGVENPMDYNEPVELAIFTRGPSDKEEDEKAIWTEKRLLAKDETVLTVTVKEKPFEVGVDPYNILVDRVARDNRKTIAFD
jgi:ABC-2 type transport system permease protein